MLDNFCSQVKLGFLPVGHTHEDIDQLFSCISRRLKHKSAVTIPGIKANRAFFPRWLVGFVSCAICRDPYSHFSCVFYVELTQAIQSSFVPKPKVILLESVTDAKAWMHEQTPPLHDHLKAHQFKFVHTAEGTMMFYKEWSTDNFWLPQTGLAVLPAKNLTPTQQPVMIRPYYDPDNIKKLEITLRKVSYCDTKQF